MWSTPSFVPYRYFLFSLSFFFSSILSFFFFYSRSLISFSTHEFSSSSSALDARDTAATRDGGAGAAALALAAGAVPQPVRLLRRAGRRGLSYASPLPASLPLTLLSRLRRTVQRVAAAGGVHTRAPAGESSTFVTCTCTSPMVHRCGRCRMRGRRSQRCCR
jgi:hypothetical protein